jgi:hypothetical protein
MTCGPGSSTTTRGPHRGRPRGRRMVRSPPDVKGTCVEGLAPVPRGSGEGLNALPLPNRHGHQGEVTGWENDGPQAASEALPEEDA